MFPWKIPGLKADTEWYSKKKGNRCATLHIYILEKLIGPVFKILTKDFIF